MEAQAKNQSSPQPVGQDGGVQVLEVFPKLASTTSSESPLDDQIEEIVRSSDDFGLPEMDFGQDSLDMSLFVDLS